MRGRCSCKEVGWCEYFEPRYRRQRSRGCTGLEIVRLGIPRLVTWRKQKQGCYEKVIWPPMALRIGLLRSSALQNDGLDAPVTLAVANSSGDQSLGPLGPKLLFHKICVFASHPVPSLGIPSVTISRSFCNARILRTVSTWRSDLSDLVVEFVVKDATGWGLQ